MKRTSALRRTLVATTAATLAVTAIMVTGAPTASAAKPKTGGVLFFLEHTPRLDHYDPSRIYTGRDLAFMNSYITRTLVAYNPVPGEAGTLLVPDLATNTGVPRRIIILTRLCDCSRPRRFRDACSRCVTESGATHFCSPH